MRKRHQQNRFVRPFSARIRSVQYRLERFIHAAAVLMVLFLVLIAAVLYLNDKYLSEQNAIQIEPVVTPTTGDTAVATPTESPPNLPTPGLFPELPSRGIAFTPDETEKPSSAPEAIITPIQDSSSISMAEDFLPLPSPAISPDPDGSPEPYPGSSPPKSTPLPSPSPPGTLQEPQPTGGPAITPPPPSPASPSAAPKNTTSRKASEKEVLVVVDPGHGGMDPGTCSVYKEDFYEKDINLDIALKLKAFLEASKVSVLMTRESDNEAYLTTDYDYNESLRLRPEIANRNQATLFVSIHVNAYDTKLSGGDKVHGTEVYYADKSYGSFTGRQFAEMMGKAIDKKTETKYNGVIQRNFTVLRLSNMPALLVETAYLTNREDHRRLESDAFRSAMAEGIHDGIIDIIKAMGAYREKEKWFIP